MSSTTRRTRGLAALATTALLGATLVGAPPAAVAAPALDGSLAVDANVSIDGPVTCTVTSGGEANAQVVLTSGVRRSRTVSATATVTDSADLGDVTQTSARASGAGKIVMTRGSLSTFELRAAASSSVEAAQGAATECDVEAGGNASVSAEFQVTSPGWLDIDVAKSRGGVVAVIVASAESVSQDFVLGVRVSARRTVLLPAAGHYVLIAVLQAISAAPGDLTPSSTTASGSVRGTFTAAGAASGPVSGTGKRYLVPAAARSCGAGQLTARWTGKAGSVRSATFLVNGRKVKTVRNPRAGTTVRLTGLAGAKDVDLVVVQRLKSGGTAKVSRSYRACQ